MDNRNLKNKAQLMAATLLATKSKNECTKLIMDLLTPNEIVSVAERIEILKSLSKGEPQRHIAKKLNCAIVTVTRGNRIMNYGTGAAKQMFKIAKS